SGSSHPVGQKVPNSLGLYDMSGNVMEWCSDESIYGNGRRNLRGGNWNHGTKDGTHHVSYHYNREPEVRRYDAGFRVVREP
ncbi:MAG: formylglycine-generating enzyme family protein, partial [Bacteroidales bacterium]|nr:formylglycine-generating enzyme family protein [Bacteroidales bacterium]